ncbi:MAG: DinB family protein [Aureispira sp.]|nr:DinB family protein [Aureispira sp.]
MITSICHQLDFNMAYVQELVKDVVPKEMTFCPAKGLENHPAFTLGHLVSGAALTVKYLGGIFELPEGWESLFLRNGPGDPRFPEKDVTKYPSKKELLVELEQQHQKIKELLHNTDIERLEKEAKEWRFYKFMPNLLDCTVFMCINHEAMHLGQLAAWRRAMGKTSALGAL